MSGDEILRVAVNAPLATAFDYLAPTSGKVRPGCRVAVPFGRRNEIGLVLDVGSEPRVARSKLRRATKIVDEKPLIGEHDLWLMRFVSDYYHHPIGEVAAAALPTLLRRGRAADASEEFVYLLPEGRDQDREALRRRAPRQAQVMDALDGDGLSRSGLDEQIPDSRRVIDSLLKKGWISVETRQRAAGNIETVAPVDGPMLTQEQQRALSAIEPSAGFAVTLLDGVTGSGKTEVYLRAMLDVLRRDRQVLVLVPEIGLTPQFLDRLQSRTGIQPALFHSGLTDTERLDTWRRARDGAAGIVLGTRSAVFIPLADPGLIVVDEEHDISYKQQDGLRYSARDLAVVRAKRLDVPVVLGSATPSLESLARARDGAYRHETLTTRAGGAVPPYIRLVDINRFRSDEGLSPPLLDAIGKHLEADGQVLVFLNRRGFAPTLICTECGHVAECARCDSRMTVHRGEQNLTCHHCGSVRSLDLACSACGGSPLPLGEGTERIEDALRMRFPGRLVTRIDSDSTRPKGAMDRALSLALSGEARILVGTQMLSKGHHFPQLTLVGVVNADQGLFSTDFRGGERLAQGLVQVAGRAGRERRQGEVIVQTAFPGHPFWSALLAGGYARVAEYALAERESAGWPPCARIALLRASAHRREDTARFLDRVAEVAVALAAEVGDVRVLGPVRAPMERLAGRFRGQLLLKARSRRPLHDLLRRLRTELGDLPEGRRVRWSVDVDPAELF